MPETVYKDVLCSWCMYDVFIPISSKLCKCYNCHTLKVLEDRTENKLDLEGKIEY